MTAADIDVPSKVHTGSSKARVIGRAATLATVLGAVFAVASLINVWNLVGDPNGYSICYL